MAQKQRRYDFMERIGIFGQGMTPWRAMKSRILSLQSALWSHVNKDAVVPAADPSSVAEQTRPRVEEEGLVGPTSSLVARLRT